VGGSNEEYVSAIEHDLKNQARQPKEHFKKLLEAARSNHTYPVKHNLKDYTMMKNFMTSRAISKGNKPEGDPSGKGTASFPGEAVVMTIYD
jgi:enamine deaminase RidA (YjgF/YER057c/UK114 family)